MTPKNKEEGMILFHGSLSLFEKFQTPEESGILRKSEEGREKNRDVVFGSPQINIARGYTKAGGYIYTVEVPDSKCITLAETKKKPSKRAKARAKYKGSVFCFKPEYCRILAVEKVS